MGYSPKGSKESDVTEQLTLHLKKKSINKKIYTGDTHIWIWGKKHKSLITLYCSMF